MRDGSKVRQSDGLDLGSSISDGNMSKHYESNSKHLSSNRSNRVQNVILDEVEVQLLKGSLMQPQIREQLSYPVN